jgi:hypothetical protein
MYDTNGRRKTLPKRHQHGVTIHPEPWRATATRHARLTISLLPSGFYILCFCAGRLALSKSGKARSGKSAQTILHPERGTVIAGNSNGYFRTHAQDDRSEHRWCQNRHVVGRDGRVWSIDEAGRLMITGQAKFLYDGKVVTDLAVLPEVAHGR